MRAFNAQATLQQNWVNSTKHLSHQHKKMKLQPDQAQTKQHASYNIQRY